VLQDLDRAQIAVRGDGSGGDEGAGCGKKVEVHGVSSWRSRGNRAATATDPPWTAPGSRLALGPSPAPRRGRGRSSLCSSSRASPRSLLRQPACFGGYHDRLLRPVAATNSLRAESYHVRSSRPGPSRGGARFVNIRAMRAVVQRVSRASEIGRASCRERVKITERAVD